ncbi:MAG: acyltransferase family protein [Nitrospira sp.]|nr:acyltransferase family protein [Nitrospira sp.]
MHYRPEIDGLRAIAVIPVILFHAGFQLFSGGFVGVDIFFVISGYLITTIILADLEAGRFSILNFYERRARRILPALYLVMASCLPFAWLWLMPSDAKELSKSVMAGLVFVPNIFFWRQSDYFDTATELKPLLHTWSLGVEEQFYVLFPLVLMFAWQLGRKRIIVLLTIMALLSLALAEYAISRKPAATFFLLPTRAWELAMGSLIAFYLEGKERGQFPPVLHQILSLVGLGMIALGSLTFSKETPFPGFSALIPTVGAALIIVFAFPGTLVGRLLVSRVFVGMGLVSYSAYLWHQPLLSYARHRSLTEPNDLVMMSLVVLAFGLAYLTWRYVETPFRRGDIVTKNVLWRFASASVVVIAVSAASLQLIHSDSQSGIPSDVQKLYRFRTCFFGLGQTFETLLQNQCHLTEGSFVQASSKEPGLSQRYVLYGDSVAAHLYPGLLSMVGENAIVQLTAGVCQAVRSGNSRRCNEFYDWFVSEYVPSNSVDAIIVSSDWLTEYKRVGEKEFRMELKELYERLKGHRVVVYSQAASLSVDIRRYVHKLENFSMKAPGDLKVGANGLTAVNTILQEETAKFGFDFLDISQLFCSEERCAVARDGIFYFWDTIHLTLPGSVLVADRTYSRLRGTVAEPPAVKPDMPRDDDVLSTSAMIVRNADGTIQYWSEGAKKLYGWEPQEALGRTSHQLLKTVFPIPLEVIEEVIRVKGHWEGQLIHERRDGSKVTVVSYWDLQQHSRSHGRSATVVEINGLPSISGSGSFRKELLSLLPQPRCSNDPPLCETIS